MKSEIKTPMHARAEGALAGVAALDFAQLDADAMITVLTAIGDALRLRMQLPLELSKKLQYTVGEEKILAALDTLRESVDRWSLPAELSADENDPGLEWALRRRDEVESVLMAARRALMPTVIVDALPNADRLADAIAAHDLTCGGKLSRSEAERLLGERLELVRDGGWLDDLAWASEEPDQQGTSDDALSGMPDFTEHARPSLKSMEAYVVDGRLRNWIESVAASSPEFAEELADMIATYREHRRAGFVARRWYESIVVFDDEQQKKAAADETTSLDGLVTEYPLGFLDPLDAKATLRVSDQAIELTVYKSRTAISAVQLGATHATPPVRGGTWTVRVARDPSDPSAIYTVHVADVAGRVFDARISFGVRRT